MATTSMLQARDPATSTAGPQPAPSARVKLLPAVALVATLPSIAIAAPRPTIARPIVRWGTRQVARARYTLKNPAARRRFLGASAVMAIDIAGGEAFQVALQPHVPELVASFASSALPTYTTYLAQQKLHVLAPKWFAEHAAMTSSQLAKDALFGGVVGTWSGNLVSDASTQLTTALSPHLSIALGTVMGMNEQAATQVMNAMQWTVSQYGSEVLGNTSLSLRDRTLSAMKRLARWRETK